MKGLRLFIKVGTSPLLSFPLLSSPLPSSPLPDGCSLIKLSYLREVNTLRCPDYTDLAKRTMWMCVCVGFAYVFVCMENEGGGGGGGGY